MERASLAKLVDALAGWAQSNPELSLALVLASIACLAAVAVAWRRRRAAARARAGEPPREEVVAAASPTTAGAGPAALGGVAPRESVTSGPATPAATPPPTPPVAEAGLAPAAPAPAAPAARPRPARLAERLARTRDAFVGRLGRLVAGRQVDAEVLDELEALLLGADLGVKTAESLLASVRAEVSGGDGASLRRVLRAAMLEKLRRVEPAAECADAPAAAPDGPQVILVLGVNGSGKTTTIGKLAARLAAQGRRVVLGAGDTFRAAAIEQLEIWGERVGCPVVKGQAGGDPAAVAYDTVKAARARGADVAIIDTAGRLQTRAPLVEELRKIVRVIGRECPGAPHETLLVLDANTGQNAISQARVFTEAAGVTGLVLTKLDGTAKGGVLVGLADEFGIPVRYVGVGEGVEDLREFRAEEFVDALFASEEEAA